MKPHTKTIPSFLQVMMLFVLQSVLYSGNASASTVNVFFAGGQSNAKPVWADAIQNTLVASGRYQNVMMISTMHSGNALNQWFDMGAPQANYQQDFFSPAGTGLVQQATNTISAQGDTYVFTGFFWFQGESDQQYPSSTQLYGERFRGMMGQLDADLGGHSGFPAPVSLALIDYNPAYDSTVPVGTKDHIEVFRQVQRDLVSSIPLGSYYDTRGYTRTDAYHLTLDALTTVGVGMADTFLAATAPTPVPAPAAFWLLGSGLLGLMGATRQRKRQS